MSLPIQDYVRERIGRTWNKHDAEYVTRVVAQIEQTAAGIRDAALEEAARTADAFGNMPIWRWNRNPRLRFVLTYAGRGINWDDERKTAERIAEAIREGKSSRQAAAQKDRANV